MVEIDVYRILLVPVILGLIQAAKIVGLPKNYSPILAVVLGAIAGPVYITTDNIAAGILIGIALGLSSIGLYSGTRNFSRKKEDK
ncbi:hypothetical protein QGM71_19480 [Virgibacillus sp. C22-A2]|uniref:Holin n=1 Tax=Virgibacillus tibetensis TaxID=3042313 RepID=A0ABU6KKB6_9BACI|nr:hypothetical protein [Virgibacillus sp. C22-A2]